MILDSVFLEELEVSENVELQLIHYKREVQEAEQVGRHGDGGDFVTALCRHLLKEVRYKKYYILDPPPPHNSSKLNLYMCYGQNRPPGYCPKMGQAFSSKLASV